MNREVYQEYLFETSSLISQKLLQISQKYNSFDSLLNTRFRQIYVTRLNKKLLKPTLFRVVYEMYGGISFEKYIDVALIFELLNISSYQANSSFDNKIATFSKDEKDGQFISSFLTREIINNIILNSNNLSDNEKLFISKQISNINENIYLAQHFDLNLLTVNNYRHYLNDYNLFINDYFARCRLGSGIFSGIVAQTAFFFANNGEIDNNIYRITEKYGTLLHMINDLGDYLPEQKYLNRYYQDNLSDFKNGRLTLPLYLLLQNNPDKNFSSYSENNIQKEIFPYLLKTKSIILNQYKVLNKELKIIPDNSYGNIYKIMLSTLKSNKYYYSLKNKSI